MTPTSTQNLKALGLWVFFFICCSTLSFLLNVGLRLTLGYHLLKVRGEKHRGDQTIMRTGPTHKGMTSTSTQSLNVLG